MKEEALKLADILEGSEVPTDTEIFEASAMIRRLVEELDKQWYMVNKNGYVKPLSDEEIKELSELTSDPDPTDFVRAIEERHGIK